ncbi:hypothetical protein [Aquabacterium humicola]|uniref:hypothetical protein n=1 Tax=Aquabacterium humicola TaxID=3237377 RepID=UPI002543DBD0|nr:hypothetical protein [Rubrivivax pictus]
MIRPVSARHVAAVLATVLAGSAPSLSASGPERTPVEDIKSLMLAAIEAPDGRAKGTLSGQVADALTQRFRGTSPVYIDVSTERRFAQPGCSRLQLRIWQEGVRLPGSREGRRQTIEIGINYCRDGKPPRSLQ